MKTKVKRKDQEELRAKKISELQSLLQKAEAELVKLRMEKASDRTKDTTVLRKKKREIAVIKTLIRGKQLTKMIFKQ